MRPVNKWIVGHVFLVNGQRLSIKEDYKPFNKAKPFLCKNLGIMCSYCEKVYQDERDLAVEHVQPKKYKDQFDYYIYASLETKWSNFLLSCDTCNGSDNKGVKNVIYGKCHLPHINNTYLSLKYNAGVVVTVNPTLSGKSKDNAEELLKLVGLNKSPKESRKGDVRWRLRSQSWDLAVRYLHKYKNKKVDLDTLMDLIILNGNWSIWFTVFIGIDEVRKELIDRFPGTAKECFDANNHYEPVFRNPNNIEDPV